MTNEIQDILKLPQTFLEVRTKSIYDLLMATHYPQHSHEISVKDIEAQLKAHAGFVDLWLQYSADQRVSTGWYIRMNNTNEYEVGFTDSGHHEHIHKFRDKYQACADYIKKELDAILNL